jgi:phage terminase large subunit-like protein
MTALLEEPPIIGAQRPRMSSIPDATSFAAGEDAVEFAGKAGLVLDDWQSWSLTRAMGTRADGHWAAFEVCWIIPRQNGKNSGLEARQLAGLFVIGEALQIHTAHEFKASSEHFLRMQSTIRANPELLRKVKPNGIRTSHGEEAIELRPTPTLIFGPRGSQVRKSVAPRLRFLARSRGSGRSFTCDCLYYDEDMILSDEEVSASMPTMSAVPNPQMWYTASAGHPDSIQLAQVRNRGIAGTDPTLMYAEWSVEFCPDLCPHRKLPQCPDGHDRRGDPRSWARANPGMNIRISEEHITREHIKMPAAGFDRERLGVGDWPVGDQSWAVIPQHEWDACAWGVVARDGEIKELELPRPKRIAVSVDITPDQAASSIAIAGLLSDYSMKVKDEETGAEALVPACSLEIGSDGTWDDHRAGIEWIIPRLKELKSRQRVAAIVIDPIGPGSELITACEKEPGLAAVLVTCQLRDVAQAHAQFLRGVHDRTIVHRGQDDLGEAVAAAVQRDVGDGMHAWARKNTTQDISPLCAATMAVWAARKFGRGYDPLKSVA